MTNPFRDVTNNAPGYNRARIIREIELAALRDASMEAAYGILNLLADNNPLVDDHLWTIVEMYNTPDFENPRMNMLTAAINRGFFGNDVDNGPLGDINSQFPLSDLWMGEVLEYYAERLSVGISPRDSQEADENDENWP